jgi:hypothetical protein
MMNYLDLLKIRQRARKRDATILGAFFVILLLAIVGFGLVKGLGNRELYFVVPIVFLHGIGYVFARTRLEITNETIEMLRNLMA